MCTIKLLCVHIVCYVFMCCSCTVAWLVCSCALQMKKRIYILTLYHKKQLILKLSLDIMTQVKDLSFNMRGGGGGQGLNRINKWVAFSKTVDVFVIFEYMLNNTHLPGLKLMKGTLVSCQKFMQLYVPVFVCICGRVWALYK